MAEQRVARYKEIESWLRAKCQSSAPGTLLPPELELAEQFQVSRMTARQAVQNLAQEGLIERRRGVGSFVAAQPLHRADAVLYSFTQDMTRRGLRPTSKVLAAAVGTAPAEAEALGLPSTAWVVRIDRIRYANDLPVARERVTLPGDYAGVLEYDLAAGSLHAALADMGRVMARASGYVMARLATGEDAKLLDLELPATLLVETRLITDVEGRPVERTETSYVGSRWVIDTGSYVPMPDGLPAPDAASAAPIAPAQDPSAAGTTE
ncbi:GntR family transcriptional regulator [Propioniciclava coleopterorum]|uniref:GntR family transcriptional regulator n=1 Tax=Propioniciclava coleopterorum TaxID=2714937 RepID=A0A6G7Y974_9ACTN|nr:GntR family transcriptional regulator [Propioniciclava coleopterorum]QIK73167.1 GntR family transcriptional regulator [Propioniciclava coleopterorum]